MPNEKSLAVKGMDLSHVSEAFKILGKIHLSFEAVGVAIEMIQTYHGNEENLIKLKLKLNRVISMAEIWKEAFEECNDDLDKNKLAKEFLQEASDHLNVVANCVEKLNRQSKIWKLMCSISNSKLVDESYKNILAGMCSLNSACLLVGIEANVQLSKEEEKAAEIVLYKDEEREERLRDFLEGKLDKTTTLSAYIQAAIKKKATQQADKPKKEPGNEPKNEPEDDKSKSKRKSPNKNPRKSEGKQSDNKGLESGLEEGIMKRIEDKERERRERLDEEERQRRQKIDEEERQRRKKLDDEERERRQKLDEEESKRKGRLDELEREWKKKLEEKEREAERKIKAEEEKRQKKFEKEEAKRKKKFEEEEAKRKANERERAQPRLQPAFPFGGLGLLGGLGGGGACPYCGSTGRRNWGNQHGSGTKCTGCGAEVGGF